MVEEDRGGLSIVSGPTLRRSGDELVEVNQS
jgi:hypothetical protein